MSISVNRFAALIETESEEEEDKASSSSSSSPASSSPVTRTTFSLTHGRRLLAPQTEPTAADNMATPSLNTISFFGRCFQCHYMSHSQKYCPLRQCKTCKEFGHSEIMCQRVQNKFTRGTLALRSGRSTGTTEGADEEGAEGAGADDSSEPAVRVCVTSDVWDRVEDDAFNDA